MKSFNFFFVTIAILQITVANAQSPLTSKSWQKNWASFTDGKWMMKTEVSNAAFRYFLEDMLAAGKEEEYEFFYPDTLGFKKNSFNAPYSSYYFSHPSFKNYPVVNITYQAAYAYCRWLTESYSKLGSKPFGEVIFRLPTHEEWMLAARSGNQDERIYSWEGTKLKKSKEPRLGNYLPEGPTIEEGNSDGFNERASLMAPINAFYPNEAGLYNMSGNVAEMVSERGVAAGGSYLDKLAQVRIDSQKAFEKSAPDIGVRVLMERK